MMMHRRTLFQGRLHHHWDASRGSAAAFFGGISSCHQTNPWSIQKRGILSNADVERKAIAAGTSSSTTAPGSTSTFSADSATIGEEYPGPEPLTTILRRPQDSGDKGSVRNSGETSAGGGVDVIGWFHNVPVEREARTQILNLASMKEVVKHPIAAMPDLHFGNGTTVGSVIPTTKAIIPAAVGVDIGCGMLAVRTSMKEEDLPTNLAHVRLAIETAVPHGRTHNGQQGNDAGGWRHKIPAGVANAWKNQLNPTFQKITYKYPILERTNNINHLGTLGTGNHFVELCLDEVDRVWVMLHTGSRGVGNKIGAHFIELAQKDMGKLVHNLPNAQMAYLREGTQYFDDYVEAFQWAQDFARINREVMMENIIVSLRHCHGIKPDFTVEKQAINCHHNYIEKTQVPSAYSTTKHSDDVKQELMDEVWLTRKGATSAKKGELAIIPGSMGRCSYIVEGKGNPLSYCSCSHGAGRQYSRGESTRRFTVEQHEEATKGIECRKDKDVLDETPLAYKDIDDVMAAQVDLVDIKHKLRQVVCVKG